MGFVSNEFLSSSGVCHYCYEDTRFRNPTLWAIHILLEHPTTNQAIRLKERGLTRKCSG